MTDRPGAVADGGVSAREQIVRAAADSLLENGYAGTSVRSIAARAGVAIGNLQYYFPTRPAVLRAVMEPLIAGYLDELKEALNGGAQARETLDALDARVVLRSKSSGQNRPSGLPERFRFALVKQRSA